MGYYRSQHCRVRQGVGVLLISLAAWSATGPAHSSASGLYDFAAQYPGFGQAVDLTSRPAYMPAPTIPGNPTSYNTVAPTPVSPSSPEVAGYTEDSTFSELRLGVLAHNVGPIASKTEEGVDLNVEVLFAVPDLFNTIGEPRPFVGASVNIGDDTSFLYGGLMWDFDFTNDIFASLGLGMAVHNGNDGRETDSEGRRALGCSWLFRESVELGYRISDDVAIAAFLDHVSHGGLCSSRNRGMDNTGVRLHYKL